MQYVVCPIMNTTPIKYGIGKIRRHGMHVPLGPQALPPGAARGSPWWWGMRREESMGGKRGERVNTGPREHQTIHNHKHITSSKHARQSNYKYRNVNINR